MSAAEVEIMQQALILAWMRGWMSHRPTQIQADVAEIWQRAIKQIAEQNKQQDEK